jgi:nucleoside 2-deoxyribosyltransferase
VNRIYIAGPIMLGDRMANIRVAIDAANALRDLGFAVFVPQLDSFWSLVHPREYEDWMAHDFAWIDVCDGLLRIPGVSSGADREIRHATGRGIPVFFEVDDVARHFRSGAV